MPTDTTDDVDVIPEDDGDEPPETFCLVCHEAMDDEDASPAEIRHGIHRDCFEQSVGDDGVWWCESCGDRFLNDDWDWYLNRAHREAARPTTTRRGYQSWYDVADDLVVDLPVYRDRFYADEYGDDGPYCEPCYDRVPRGQIHSYSYKPVPVFLHTVEDDTRTRIGAKRVTTTPLYLGYELEMENAAQHCDTILEAFPDGSVYLKHDGSLDCDGVELVTHPGTLNWHMTETDWSGFDRMIAAGCRSFNYESTGMHVHVSRSAFTRSHMWRFLMFHWHNVDIIQAVAQRGHGNYHNWRDWLPERPKAITFAKGEDSQITRSCALNLHNSETVELRYFKGNLKPEAVKRNLQWCHAIYEWTKNLTGADSKRPPKFEQMRPWLLNRSDTYPDLVGFLQSRSLI